MASRAKALRRAGGVLLFAVVAFLAVIQLFPTLWAVMTSLKRESEVVSDTIRLFPSRVTFENYAAILSSSDNPILMWFLNSVTIAVSYVVAYLAVSSLAAFAFARLTFRGRDTIFLVLLASMMIPGIINFIPNYVIIDKLHLLDRKLAMILPGLSGVFGVFLLRQFMSGLPMELDEAATIDGANRMQIYLRVVLPMCGPALATLAIFSFQGNWNDFMWPLLVTNMPETRTLTAGLYIFQGSYVTSYGKLMAGAVLSAVPVFFIFLIGQKYFVQGISLSGIKG